jgi:hypothetical protein
MNDAMTTYVEALEAVRETAIMDVAISNRLEALARRVSELSRVLNEHASNGERLLGAFPDEVEKKDNFKL